MSATWMGYCTGCHRDGLEVASRLSHHQRVLCTRCVETATGRRRDLRDLGPPPANTPAKFSEVSKSRKTFPRLRDARQRVVDALELGAGYIDRDTVGAVCPLCRGPLAVRFRGELVDLECCDGCAEDDVTAAVFGEGMVI